MILLTALGFITLYILGGLGTLYLVEYVRYSDMAKCDRCKVGRHCSSTHDRKYFHNPGFGIVTFWPLFGILALAVRISDRLEDQDLISKTAKAHAEKKQKKMHTLVEGNGETDV